MREPPLPSHPIVNLAPGDLVMARAPHVLTTILGSCVAVTTLHRPTGLAGMCHAMLPEQRGSTGEGGPFRYLDRAIAHMVQWFGARGVAPTAIEVKVFGGADVLVDAALRDRDNIRTIGAMNVEALGRLLALHGLVPVRSSLGGRSGLKLYFDTGTGDVLVRRLHRVCATCA